MSKLGIEEDDEAALSDFEDDDLEAAPVVLPAPAAEGVNAPVAELDSERQARSLAEAQAKCDRLKKELDEALHQKEEAIQSKEELRRLLKQRDEAIKQLDVISKHREDAIKAREQSRSEIESAARLLVTGAEKLTSLVGDSKSFSGGLSRSSKYTGLAAICHGFCKRAEEIVEEVLKQRDAAVKSRNEIRDQMDQRNFQIAIEVSQLEASIAQSREELERRTAEWHKLSAEKLGVQSDLQERLARATSEADILKKNCENSDEKARTLEVKLEKLKGMLVEQFKGYLATEESFVNFLHKIDGKAVKSVSALPFSDFNDVDKVHQEYVRRVNSISDMLVHMENSWEDKEEARRKEISHLESSIRRFSKKQKDVVAIIKHTLADRQEVVEAQRSSDEGSSTVTHEPMEEDILTLVSILDGDLRHTRVKILDLERQLADARVEIDKMSKVSLLQAKDLAVKSARIHELEEKDGVISENVEGLAAEIAAAEEELARWKKAATEEAAAGVAILEEVERCNQEIAALNQLVIHLKQSLEEANNKLQSKEEMAAAAMAARNAAERSLKMADERAAELRERLEEMSRELEEAEAQLESSRVCGGRVLELFPWVREKLLSYRSNFREAAQASAEMEELTEPLV